MYRILLILVVSSLTFAQVKVEGDPDPKPLVKNAKLETVNASQDFTRVFDQAVKRAGAHWIGYKVATTPKSRLICCFDSFRELKNAGNKCCFGCKLERESGSSFFNSDKGSCTDQTPARAAFVLFRADQGQVQKIRTFTPDCGLDFSGMPLVWLEDVQPRASIALLQDFVSRTDRSVADDENADNDDDGKYGKKSFRVADGAIQAIALHADGEADQVLARFVSPGQPSKVREQAAFWAANERGGAGFELLQRVVPTDADARFRREGTFALSQSSEEREAIQLLLRMARNDQDDEVREQAIFWLAQHAGREAVKGVTDAVENDPESKVRKKAVFALSQMPEDQGVPLLIQYAKTHKDPIVRKEAIFWLGQAHDKRALDFIEQLLLAKSR
jgi:hypothetical protein